jgi:hypothetical protein
MTSPHRSSRGGVLAVLEPRARVQSPPCCFCWLRLRIERIKPAHPELNGRPERMHLTVKMEATKAAAKNLHVSQERFDASCTSTITSACTSEPTAP